MSDLSPMMQHYLQIKKQNSDAVVLYRVGDFYEMFYEDAQTASKELSLFLTAKDCGLEERAPMCGMPYHACDSYIQRLISKGYKVAICEQVEDPASAKGLVKREVIRVITPGTVTDGEMLDETKNNYLCSAVLEDDIVGLCFVDISTGEAYVTELSGDNISDRLISEIGRFMPSEILLNRDASMLDDLVYFLKNKINTRYEVRDDADFDKNIAVSYLKSHCRSYMNLFDGRASMAKAFSCITVYLLYSLKKDYDNINRINYYSDAQYMQLDLSARTNLELTKNIRTREKKGSLLWVIDKTCSAMGRRLMNTWIEQPLLSTTEIIKRQNSVDELFSNGELRDNISYALSQFFDVERTITKIVYSSVKPKELRALGQSLYVFPRVKDIIKNCTSTVISNLYKNILDFTPLADEIVSAVKSDPPTVMRDGGYINDNYDEALDEARADVSGSSNILAEIESREKERTGIRTLKVKFNRVFGYYIEVSNNFKNLVPSDYIRKQTLTGGERYITEELKTIESRVLGAKERSIAIEHEIYEKLKQKVTEKKDEILSSARAVAVLDVLNSLAEAAVKYNYICPVIGNEGLIEIRNGRHPVVERILETPFVPNDIILDKDENRCLIITGPNMAGKSTYMRQTALISIMAQIGSFVPASYARVDIVDAVFTRIGASDDLVGGQSTFMVEMTEIANILKYATSDSLLILDEIGRGTSTYDGMSIARAVLEYVCDKKKLGAKTLFSTHYHELTDLEESMQGLKNFNILVKKKGSNITFLRKIVRGGADESYGIDVARLSGIPESVIHRARKILESIDKTNISFKDLKIDEEDEEEDMQISFSDGIKDEIINALQDIDINSLTPIEALSALNELSDKAKNI